LTSEAAGAGLGQGAFKRVHFLAQTGYVAAELLSLSISESDMRGVLEETSRQLRLRRQALREKLTAMETGRTYTGGGRHIVKTVGFDIGTRRLVMKYGGYPLSRLVERLWRPEEVGGFVASRKNPLIRLMASVARQVLEGFVFSHGHSVIHADIKLDNIVVDSRGKVTLIDWGVSAEAGAKPGGGTAAYISRQRLFGAADAAARPTEDLFALGRTLCFMVAGSDRVNPQEALGTLRGLDDTALSEFVDKCLAAEGVAAGGFSSADEALDHRFPASAPRALESLFMQHYAKRFFTAEESHHLAEFYDPAATARAASERAKAMADAVPRRPMPPDPHARQDFEKQFPTLVHLLTTVTNLAAEVEDLRDRIRSRKVASGDAAAAAARPAPTDDNSGA
jgi:serine/threonine protein kinase